jgi:hypothetical protein
MSLFSLFVWIDIIANWANGLLFRAFKMSVVPEILWLVVPLHGTAFALFVFHSAEYQSYEGMEASAEDDRGLMPEDGW